MPNRLSLRRCTLWHAWERWKQKSWLRPFAISKSIRRRRFQNWSEFGLPELVWKRPCRFCNVVGEEYGCAIAKPRGRCRFGLGRNDSGQGGGPNRQRSKPLRAGERKGGGNNPVARRGPSFGYSRQTGR